MKIFSKGFAAAEMIMVLVTLAVVGGGLYFVMTQEPPVSDEAIDEAQTEEVSIPPDSNGDASERLTEANARDEVRKQHIKLVAEELEAFYSKDQQYPTSANFGSASWRSENLYVDEQSEAAYTEYEISYNVRPNTCDNETFICVSFDVSVDLERDGLGENDSDKNTADAIEISVN